MAVKPWFDVINWVCPICGVGGLDFKEERCYYCNCELDWSGINAEVDNKEWRYSLL